MKTISLRQFRDSVADLTESVQVVKREDDGLVTLGTWTPLESSMTRITRQLDKMATGFGHPSPAPKRK